MIQKILDWLKSLFGKKNVQPIDEHPKKLSKSEVSKIRKYWQKYIDELRKMNKRPREEFPCKICHKPMLVGSGQIAYFHKECKRLRSKKGRQLWKLD